MSLTLWWANVVALFAGLTLGGLLYGPMGAILGCLISQFGLIVLLLKNVLRLERIKRITRGITDKYVTPENEYEAAMDYIVAAADKERRKNKRI